MSRHDIIVVGASTGGIDAQRRLLGALPAGFPASVFIVQHSSPEAPGILPQILARDSRLPVAFPRHTERVEAGRVYVAPPDQHLLLETDGSVRLSRGPKENRFRPAVDPLFRSAARAYGPRVVGVVLTGGLDDGTAGLLAVKRRGGAAVVQDPEEAVAPSMPLSAMTHVKIDYCLPLAEIGPTLVRLASEPATSEGGYPVSDELDIEVKIAMEDKAVDAGVMGLGDPSSYACPDCHGVLLRLKAEGPMRFRCHTGHAYTADSLLAGVTENIEDTLWSTIRALEEAEMLVRHVGRHLSEGGQQAALAALAARADELRRRADLVRQATFTPSAQAAGE